MSRRTKKQINQLKDQIYEVLKADHPQSVRHVFYRMTDPRLPESVKKNKSGYRTVADQLLKLRKDEERVPFEWVVDNSRSGWFTHSYSSPEEFVKIMSSRYRQDMWRDTNKHCVVWCESKSIAGIIQPVCSQYVVDLFPTGGYPSETFVYENAQELNNYYSDCDVHAIYIGDYDADGLIISDRLEEKIRYHLHQDVTLHFNRMGINEDQIKNMICPENKKIK